MTHTDTHTEATTGPMSPTDQAVGIERVCGPSLSNGLAYTKYVLGPQCRLSAPAGLVKRA